MAVKDYDRSLNRMILILHKLWNNERPTMQELASEFGVSLRTIQRDINERLRPFYIIKDEKGGHLKFMDGHNLESALIDDEMLALALAIPLLKGSSTKIDEIASNVLYKLVRKSLNNPYFIKPDGFQFIDMDAPMMNQIEDAIKSMKTMLVTLDDNQKLQIDPYKIIAYNGIWYLFARDTKDGKIKNFFIHKINNVQCMEQEYTLDHSIAEMIDNIQTPWFEDAHQFEVIIHVSSSIAHYFELKKQLPSQLINEKKEDGSLIISYLVSHAEEVDNLIKSWMPDIQIIKPLYLKNRLISELDNYLQILKNDSPIMHLTT